MSKFAGTVQVQAPGVYLDDETSEDLWEVAHGQKQDVIEVLDDLIVRLQAVKTEVSGWKR